LNTDDLATFLNSTKNPPIWRVLWDLISRRFSLP
jgi:hypothetical protein